LSDRWFRLLVDIMTDGYAFIDSRGIVVDSNPQFVRMLGLPRRAVIGHAVREFVAIETRKIGGKRGAHGIPAGYHGEATLRRADGQSIPVIALVRNTTAAEAGVAGSCLIVTDVAEGARGPLPEGESEKDRRCYSCQILNAQESERKRIATELHDGLGQSLSIIKFKLEQAIAKLDSNTSVDATAMLEELVPRVKGTLDEVRRIAMNLRPSTLEDLGILATLSWFIREYGSVYHSISVDKSIDVRESDVPDALKLPLFRIVQEALNNVAKHSRATRAFVGVEKRNGVLRLLIEDNGVGFDLGEVASRRGPATTCGHAGMRDRVALSGGSLTIESTPRIGVRIAVTWPDLDVPRSEDQAAASERL
jgi:PAS domain S-box-containing protein